MKRVQIIFIFLLSVFISACESESILIQSEQSLLTFEILTRGLNNDSHLPHASSILMNATGGLQINNETFTYNGATWGNGNNYNWSDSQEETNITALYPVYKDKKYSIENLYSDGGLEDVLISQQTFRKGEPIQLQFRHLFSLLTIHIEQTVLHELTEIQLTSPLKVDEISPSTGLFSTINEEHTTIQTNNESCEYPFIIPPSNDCVVTLTLIMKDGKTHTHRLPPYTFECGFEYKCNVIKPEERPGIRTAKELVIFSQLINGIPQEGYSLENFGEQTENGWVFRLLDDILLEEEHCDAFIPIGKNDDAPFAYTFDGENHTITNLIIPDTQTEDGYAGLFGHIGSTGVVKNIHITHATSITNPTCKYVGVITGYNEGLIDNCSVQNSTINSAQKGMIGLICSSSGGKIINCYTQNNTIKVSTESNAGAIAGSADGYILNCYTRNNQFSLPSGSYKTGCITGASSYNTKLTIENCYIHHSKSNKYWGAAVGNPYKVTLNNFFHNIGEALYNSTNSSAKKYDTNFCIDGIPITDSLNEWIDNGRGKNNYSQFTFNQWDMTTDTPPYFIGPQD